MKISHAFGNKFFEPSDSQLETLIYTLPKDKTDRIDTNFFNYYQSLQMQSDISVDLEVNTQCLYLDEETLKRDDLNSVFEYISKILVPEQLFSFKTITSENIKEKLSSDFPSFFITIYYPFHFVVRRIFPKVKGLREITKFFNLPIDRSKSEILGRLIFNGFEIVSVHEVSNETFVKVKINPGYCPDLTKIESADGILFKMRRLGKDAKKITVYKFRSMHPYSEYVQEYIHINHGLDVGGKFFNDFRISTIGQFIRKYWIDELPMLYNWMKGDLKLVGVRPISEHYFNLYPTELQNLRIKNKPGLLPPYYADMPKTLDEIVESELRYLKKYDEKPFLTDCIYLMKIIKNIFLRKARSK